MGYNSHSIKRLCMVLKSDPYASSEFHHSLLIQDCFTVFPLCNLFPLPTANVKNVWTTDCDPPDPLCRRHKYFWIVGNGRQWHQYNLAVSSVVSSKPLIQMMSVRPLPYSKSWSYELRSLTWPQKWKKRSVRLAQPLQLAQAVRALWSGY